MRNDAQVRAYNYYSRFECFKFQCLRNDSERCQYVIRCTAESKISVFVCRHISTLYFTKILVENEKKENNLMKWIKFITFNVHATWVLYFFWEIVTVFLTVSQIETLYTRYYMYPFRIPVMINSFVINNFHVRFSQCSALYRRGQPFPICTPLQPLRCIVIGKTSQKIVETTMVHITSVTQSCKTFKGSASRDFLSWSIDAIRILKI